MDNIIDIKNGKPRISGSKAEHPSPMRFFSREAATKSAPPRNMDNETTHDRPIHTVAMHSSECRPWRHNPVLRSLKSIPRRIDDAVFHIQSLTYYPLRDFIFRQIANRQLHALIRLARKLERRTFNVNISLYGHGAFLSVSADYGGCGTECYTRVKVLFGALPGYWPHHSLSPRDVKNAIVHLRYLSKLEESGVPCPVDATQEIVKARKRR